MKVGRPICFKTVHEWKKIIVITSKKKKEGKKRRLSREAMKFGEKIIVSVSKRGVTPLTARRVYVLQDFCRHFLLTHATDLGRERGTAPRLCRIPVDSEGGNFEKNACEM